jgi:hypothetical protein
MHLPALRDRFGNSNSQSIPLVGRSSLDVAMPDPVIGLSLGHAKPSEEMHLSIVI